MPEVSILISARDNYSEAITRMRNANSAFERDASGLQNKLDALNRTKTVLKIDASRMRSEIQAAQRAIGNLNSEAADTSELERLQREYEQLQQNLSLVTREARTTQRELEAVGRVGRRETNRAGASSGAGTGSSESARSGILKSLASAGLVNTLGNAFAGATSAAISSAFGSETGTLVNSTLSGAASGAAMGAIAGPAGAAIGGLIGAGAGVISGASQVFENQDQAYKQAVQEQYQEVTQKQQQDLASGSQIAAQRETDLISFSTLFQSKEKANSFLKELKDMANTTPFLYDDLTAMSKTLKTYGYDENNILPTLESVGNAGAALGMSTDSMNMVATAIGRMRSSDKATLEYINILNDRGVDVVGYIAENLGKSKGEVYDLISDGKLSGVEVSDLIIQKFDELYKGAMEEQSKTYSGLESTLEGMEQEMQNALGGGYNEERSRGMQNEIRFYESEAGEEMKEANKYIGEYKASLENLQEEMKMDAWKSISEGKRYSTFSEESQDRLAELSKEYSEAKAKDDGATMGRIQMEAQVIAATEYKKTEGAQLEIESQKALVSGIQEAMAQDGVYKDFGYNMGLEFDKGFLSALRENDPATEYAKGTYAWNNGGSTSTTSSTYAARWQAPTKSGSAKAFGMSYVPYNNFPALLHEGERVLTASQARQYDAGGSLSITINLGGVSTRMESRQDAEEIARVIAEEVAQALETV